MILVFEEEQFIHSGNPGGHSKASPATNSTGRDRIQVKKTQIILSILFIHVQPE